MLIQSSFQPKNTVQKAIIPHRQYFAGVDDKPSTPATSKGEKKPGFNYGRELWDAVIEIVTAILSIISNQFTAIVTPLYLLYKKYIYNPGKKSQLAK